MVGKKFGDFEITGEIGKGGMGQVYKARQISLDRDVAIKVLPSNLSEVEEFRDRFDVEAKAVASLMHENILQIYSKGVTDDGVHYFAMEFVDGEDLADKIQRGAVFTEAEALDIAAQACSGLEAAWKKNIIHRDIKPSNLMLTKDGVVKIADFGLAKSLDATRKLTQTNMYMGTVAYTSPEQGEGKALDNRTDVYSLGIVLYQLLTGSVPFKAETPSSVIYKHVYEAPPPPREINPKVSPEAEAVVLKAIAKKPEDRFQSAVEFRAAIEAAKKGQPMPLPAAAGIAQQAAAPAAAQAASGAAPAVPQKKSSNAVPVVVMAVVVALLFGASALYASKYGYRALLSKVIPGMAPEVQQVESIAVPPPPPGQEVVASRPELEPPAAVTSGVTPGGSATGGAGTSAVPPPAGEARVANVAPPTPAKRGPTPTVLVVTAGDQSIADIIEASIGRKLESRSISLSAAGEIQDLADRYGRHKIPLNALDQRHLKADILVYVSVSSVPAAPLQFYGRVMEQYAANISIKVIDASTKKMIGSPRSKTVNYTTLNMQDNVDEAVTEMTSDLPKKLTAFWKG